MEEFAYLCNNNNSIIEYWELGKANCFQDHSSEAVRGQFFYCDGFVIVFQGTSYEGIYLYQLQSRDGLWSKEGLQGKRKRSAVLPNQSPSGLSLAMVRILEPSCIRPPSVPHKQVYALAFHLVGKATRPSAAFAQADKPQKASNQANQCTIENAQNEFEKGEANLELGPGGVGRVGCEDIV